jgi:hypothetical protein
MPYHFLRGFSVRAAMESYGTSHHGDGKQSAEMLELRTEIEKVKANLYDIEQQIFQV